MPQWWWWCQVVLRYASVRAARGWSINYCPDRLGVIPVCLFLSPEVIGNKRVNSRCCGVHPTSGKRVAWALVVVNPPLTRWGYVFRMSDPSITTSNVVVRLLLFDTGTFDFFAQDRQIEAGVLPWMLSWHSISRKAGFLNRHECGWS